MRLLAISDLHLGRGTNREALEAVPPHPDDWLILAGDVGETEDHLRFALDVLSRRFARLFWVPGNHELWTVPQAPDTPRGVERYLRFVALCREYGVATPEDPYLTWPGPGPACRIAPLFLLYDYTFGPDGLDPEAAVEWAIETGVLCVDEKLLEPDPHPSRAAWCRERLAYTEPRLAEAAADLPTVLVSHWPLHRDLLTLRRIPRFSIWCGTRATEDWHLRFRAVAMIYGHLHVRRTVLLDGVRCEEVSLGYPRDWTAERGVAPYLRQILPVPDPVEEGFRFG